MSDAGSVGFPQDHAILRHQLAVLQFNSILTLPTQVRTHRLSELSPQDADFLIFFFFFFLATPGLSYGTWCLCFGRQDVSDQACGI